MHAIDQADLAFNHGGLWLLNVILGLVMFGVALDLRVDDFRVALRRPLAPLLGLVAQFLLLPAATWALTRIIEPPPSVALGMILVASCPGGNVSNFITHISRGATAVSIAMTAISTVAAIVMTPLNLSFWGGMHPSTAAVLQDVALDPLELLATVATLLGLPLVVGMATTHWLPKVAAKLVRPFKIASIAFFGLFILVAFHKNYGHFLTFIGLVFLPVLLHNATALSLGYGMATLGRLRIAERRAVAIEVGIQNSGLGLLIIFSFFDGLGGMAVVTAWWGIWHIIAGLSLASVWGRRPAPH